MLKPPRLASRALGACALTLALLPAAQAAPVLEMSTGVSASGFELTVRVRDVVDLYAYQFTLNFDPGLLAALGATEASFLPGGGATFFHPGDIDNDAGAVTFAFGTLIGAVDGVDGSGDLVTFTFDPQKSGYASFSLSDVLLVDSTGADIAAETRDLVARVPEPAGLWLAGLGLVAAFSRRKPHTAAA